MIKNYLRIALRYIKNNKVFSIINIAGLTIGIASVILILLWVQNELSYDRFHLKSDRIFRVVFSGADDGTPTNANGSFGIGPALKRDFPEVVETVRIRKMGQGVKRYVGYEHKKFYEKLFFFAEPSIFSAFDFPLIKGNPATALTEPNSIVLTENIAKKYFGNENPIGKIIEADPYNNGELMLFRVTGVAKNVPQNSHIHFDFLASYISQKEDLNRFSGFWQHYTYVLLNEKHSAELIQPKFLSFLQRHWRDDPWYTISLQPLPDIHLHSQLRSEIEPTGNILYIYIFTAIALFVLIIACINFMNLTTANSIKRAKEVGLRKVVGANKNQLICQFLGESLLLSLIATIAAFLLVLWALPFFNSLAQKEMTINILTNPVYAVFLLCIILTVGIVAGSYPSFFLSYFQPIQSLKSKTSYFLSGTILRKGLVTFQFTISIAIIIATLIALKQMNYIRNQNPGFDKEQIMVFPLNKDLRQNYEALRNELLKNPNIENTSTSGYVPTRGSMHLNVRFEGKDDPLLQVIYFIDKEFINTYGLNITSGKNIHLPLSTETESEFLVNESSVKELDYASSADAIGKSVQFRDYKGYIAGVLDDINIYSLHQEPYAITFMITDIDNHNYMSIRLRLLNISNTLAYIEETWQKIIQNYPLDYFFLDKSFENMHLADEKLSEIFTIFSILAIIVACLGLFGLAIYTSEQKTREIGIRKVLGASGSGIYWLLSQEFIIWVIAANIFAWPIAYFAMNRWIQNFAYRIDIGIYLFLYAGFLALAIALVTISIQAIKSAIANPVDSLRYE
jgi:putative ABC transport system permease protein